MRSTTPLTDTGTEPVPSAVRQKFSVADCIERITPAAPKPNATPAQSFPPDEKTAAIKADVAHGSIQGAFEEAIRGNE